MMLTMIGLTALPALILPTHVQAADAHSLSLPPRPIWSPDGQSIAYYNEGGLSVMDRDGTNVRQITPVGVLERWTSDSRGLILNIGYVVDHAEWWLYLIDGSEPQRILVEFSIIARMTYSPDGKYLALYGRKTETDLMGIWLVGVTDGIPDSNSILLADTVISAYDVWEINWTKLGDELILGAWQSATEKASRISLAINQSANQPLQTLDEAKIEPLDLKDTLYLAGGWQLDYDPDQRLNPEAYAVSTVVSHFDQVSIPLNRLIYGYAIAQSPDEQSLAYVSYCHADVVYSAVSQGEAWGISDPATQTVLYMLNVTTRIKTPIFPCGSGSQHHPSFSPDGTSMVFAVLDASGWHIYQADLLPDTELLPDTAGITVNLVDITPAD
ncbi:MAG TPA: hypothetical protein VHL11_15420 [Phototrophicaceae bacterium]|nr:hypothetical protein [Phototrophicaceae bacterium]